MPYGINETTGRSHHFIDLKDKVFDRLTALYVLPGQRCGKSLWHCKCSCGNYIDVVSTSLTRKHKPTRSCGCLATERKIKQLAGKPSLTRKRPYESVFNNLCYGAKRGNRNLPVELTYDEYVEFTKTPNCHYCHAKLTWCEFFVKGKPAGHNIDRINNSAGYTFANCVPCCARCNKCKSDEFTHDEWYRAMEQFRQESNGH